MNDKIIAELQAVIAELQIPVPTPAADPIVSITVTTESGATIEFVPKV